MVLFCVGSKMASTLTYLVPQLGLARTAVVAEHLSTHGFALQ